MDEFCTRANFEINQIGNKAKTTKIFPPKSTGMMKAVIFVGIQEKLTPGYAICLEKKRNRS